MIHTQAGADIMFVLKKCEKMVALEAYLERDILTGKVLYAKGICKDNVGGLVRVHVGVQLLHEIESQHIVIIQTCREEPIIPFGILLAYLPV